LQALFGANLAKTSDVREMRARDVNATPQRFGRLLLRRRCLVIGNLPHAQHWGCGI
jgi:hypothetical protein